MIYNKFDVIAVDFPFIDKPAITEVRPAVIVSSNNYNLNTGFVVIAMITSAYNSKLWNDIKISNFKDLELNHTSFIRMKFANITKEFILHKMGHLSDNDQKELQKLLRDIF
jgi:mRNA-degrading endonuclease toxin of MazEF toxin-antitoxin module